jgi:hypothetical protein
MLGPESRREKFFHGNDNPLPTRPWGMYKLLNRRSPLKCFFATIPVLMIMNHTEAVNQGAAP